jgi:hypothetical protein
MRLYGMPRARIASRERDFFRHCEERSDEAIQNFRRGTGLLRFARNDENADASRERGSLWGKWYQNKK